MPRQIPTKSDLPLHKWSPYTEFHKERIRAHEKHGSGRGAMERLHYTDRLWLPVLTEELGEVARVLCEVDLSGSRTFGVEDVKQLRKELIQLGAMTAAWLDAVHEINKFVERDVPMIRYRARKVTNIRADERWGPWSPWMTMERAEKEVALIPPDKEIDTEYAVKDKQ